MPSPDAKIMGYSTDKYLVPAYETCSGEYGEPVFLADDVYNHYKFQVKCNISHDDNRVVVRSLYAWTSVTYTEAGSSNKTDGYKEVIITCPLTSEELSIKGSYLNQSNSSNARDYFATFIIPNVAPEVQTYETTITATAYRGSNKTDMVWTKTFPLIFKFEPSYLPHDYEGYNYSPGLFTNGLSIEPYNVWWFNNNGIPVDSPDKVYTFSFQKPDGAAFGENALIFNLPGISKPDGETYYDLRRPDQDTGFGVLKYHQPFVWRAKFNNGEHEREYKRYAESIQYTGCGEGSLTVDHMPKTTTYTVNWEMTDADKYFPSTTEHSYSLYLHVVPYIDGREVTHWLGSYDSVSVGKPDSPKPFKKTIEVPLGSTLKLEWYVSTSSSGTGSKSRTLTQTWYNKDEGGGGESPVKLYGSVGGQAKRVTKLYGSVNGQAKAITKLYTSVGGKAKLIYQEEGGA